MKTLKKQTLPNGGEELTLFPADSPASRTASQENDLEKKMTATSGRKCLDVFEKFARNGSWAKTFSALLIGQVGWFSTKCNLTWKLKTTKYKRMYFQLAPSTPRTEGIGSGLLPMLPTPQARDEKAGSKMEDARTRRKIEQGWSMGLNDLSTMGLLPTPTVHDFRSTHAENSQAYQNRMQHHRGVPLVEHMQREMDGKSFQLNPPFVAEMMGFPPDWTELPFLNRETKASKPTEMP